MKNKKLVFGILAVTLLVAGLVLLVIFKVEKGVRVRPTGSSLGIGFGLREDTLDITSELTFENDFVDIMVGSGTLNRIKKIESLPVKVSCLSRSLDQMRETVSLLQTGGAKCDYLGYNPEQREGTPQEELNDFVGSVKTAREIAQSYGAKLVTGPGLRYISTREELYPQAASYSDVWLLQSQALQVDRETGERVPPENYQAQVERIVRLLHQGNPNIKIWVQISTTPGGHGHQKPFSAEEIVALAQSIQDFVDGVRIYIRDDLQPADTLRQVIKLLRGE